MIFKHMVNDLAELKLLLAQHTFYASRLAVSVKLYTTRLMQQDCTAQSWDGVWNTSSADNTFQGSWMAKQCFSIWSLPGTVVRQQCSDFPGSDNGSCICRKHSGYRPGLQRETQPFFRVLFLLLRNSSCSTCNWKYMVLINRTWKLRSRHLPYY